MPIVEQKIWNECVKINDDSYGKCCVDVARRVMEILDEDAEFDARQIIWRACDDVKAEGITAFMAGCVAQMVSKYHSRGEEFRKKWNEEEQLHSEGDEANKVGGVLNPALLNIEIKS